jgi:5-methyltetrahydrofolate--homocysteine methyltransferase
MSEKEILIKLKEAIINGNPDKAIDEVDKAIKLGINYDIIINETILKASDEVGKLYEKEEYFLADLLMTGDAIQGVMDRLTPLIKSHSEKTKGTIIIGTVEGDVHDIGKSLIISLLQGRGYDIIDLGVDVTPQKFLEKAKELHPDLIGLSGLVTSSISKMHETVIELKKAGIPAKIIIGGGIVSKESCNMMGADECAKDGWEGLKKVKNLLEGS